jgi:hypothetical protein
MERAKDKAQIQTQLEDYPQEEMISKMEISCTEIKESEELKHLNSASKEEKTSKTQNTHTILYRTHTKTNNNKD